MAKAKKLPSGSWRCLVYDYTDSNGKRIYKSFTSSDPSPKGKREAERLAAEYAFQKSTEKLSNDLTFGAALDKYISGREAVLSPGTIREYKRSRMRDFSSIEDILLSRITQADVQELINEKSKTAKPKTVRNIHGLISAVFREYRPDFALNTTLPQKVRPDLYIPTDADVQKLMEQASSDPDMYLAILLAAFGPMRRSEICALTSDDISGNMVHVQRAMVLDEHKQWIEKTTKSFAGDRYIPFPDFVADYFKGKKGKIINLKPNQVSDRFIDIQRASGLPHFRFHDLRHYCASIQHTMGIPDVYIMQRGGWASDTVLKQVYRHSLSDYEERMNALANTHFDALCNTKCNTNLKEP